jgi:tetratricopeptide (TPR) repeat protein
MAEGPLGRLSEETDEKPHGEGSDAQTGALAFAAAVVAIASRQDPQVARDASTLLSRYAQLLQIQTQQLEDQREGKLRRFGIYTRIAYQFFVAVVAAFIGVGILVMVWSAVTSRSVVIDRFETAPALAPSGLNGKVAASGLLDVLTKIQAATRSNAKRRLLSNAWTNDIAIEVPKTGVSIGQLEAILKTRFGHDQHIGGDLAVIEKGRLALTVRGSGILPRTFTDEPHNLDKLLTQAGEYVYGQSQPGLWTAYLSNNDRTDEAIQFAQGAYVAAEPSERPYILNYWANAIVTKGEEGAMRDALPLYREALHLKPDFWIGYLNVMNALNGLGKEEDAIREGEQLMSAAGGRPGRAPEDSYENYDSALWDLPTERAEQIADMESHSGIGTTTKASGAENLGVAQTEAQMHDVVAASVRLKTTRIDPKNFPDVAAASFARALIAQESMDLPTAAREWDTFALAYANPTVSTSNRSYICFSAPAYERTGQPERAEEALAAVGPLTLVDCYRFKADVFELRGNWAAAQDWYARTVNLAPSIPSGYYSWGLALAKHGDLVGAEAKLKDANQRGPHWADPLKAWGDVLVKQGKAKDALTKYEEALKYAPNWKALKEAREAAAKNRA